MDLQEQPTRLPQLPAKEGTRNPFAVRSIGASAKPVNPFAVTKVAGKKSTTRVVSSLVPPSMTGVPGSGPSPLSPPPSPSTATGVILHGAAVTNQAKPPISSRRVPFKKFPMKVPSSRTKPAKTPEPSSSEEEDALALADTPTSSQMEQANDDDQDGDIDEPPSDPDVKPVIEIDPSMKVPIADITPFNRQQAAGSVPRHKSPEIQVTDGYYAPLSRTFRPFVGKPPSSLGMKPRDKAGKTRALDSQADGMDVDVRSATIWEADEGMPMDIDPLTITHKTSDTNTLIMAGTRVQDNRTTVGEPSTGANPGQADPGMMTGGLPAAVHFVADNTPEAGSSSSPDIYNPSPNHSIQHLHIDHQHIQDSLRQKEESWTISPGSFAAYHLVNTSMQMQKDLERNSAQLRDLMKVERALKDASMHANDALQRLLAWKDE